MGETAPRTLLDTTWARQRVLERRGGMTLSGPDDPRQGIVHIVGPGEGVSQPGALLACGDSHDEAEIAAFENRHWRESRV